MGLVRPQFFVRTADVTGSVQLPEGTEMVMPGDTISLTIDVSRMAPSTPSIVCHLLWVPVVCNLPKFLPSRSPIEQKPSRSPIGKTPSRPPLVQKPFFSYRNIAIPFPYRIQAILIPYSTKAIPVPYRKNAIPVSYRTRAILPALNPLVFHQTYCHSPSYSHSDERTCLSFSMYVYSLKSSQLIAPVVMSEGLRFALREGGRTVGAGVVSKIIE